MSQKLIQTDPPRPPKEYLPTMYDLPSEAIGDPGVPDEFHILQPQLLTETFQPPNYASDEIFTATDMNLYFDVRHTNWYKRPDWFAVVGTSRFYEGRDMRLSYVIWQESAAPLIVVELLSPGTEKEDLGQSLRDASQPPPKWEVYESKLRVPYYVVFDRYTDEFRFHRLEGGHYVPQDVTSGRICLPEVALFLGIWDGIYQGVERRWLRWYTTNGSLVPLNTERAEHAQQQAELAQQQAAQAQQQAELAQQRAEQAQQRAEQAEAQARLLAEKLRELGVDPESLKP